MLKNGLIRKIRLISKFMMSQPVNKQWQYTYWTISQEVKAIRQLNFVGKQSTTWETFFLKNHAQNAVDPHFLKNHIEQEHTWTFIRFLFIVCQVEDYRKILKISYRPLAFTSYNWSPSSFCMIFEEKYFSYYILLLDQISSSDCLYFVRYLAVNVLQIFVN